MKISFRVFSPVSWVFSPVSWVFPPEKNIKITVKTRRTKQRTWPTEHFFSPGSSTRILSEYLKIWIKSLSALVFSFRRRLIFEVRLKFRPFGRYRFIYILDRYTYTHIYIIYIHICVCMYIYLSIYLNMLQSDLHLYAHTWAHIHTWVFTCKNTFTMPKPCDCVGKSVPAAFVVWW